MAPKVTTPASTTAGPAQGAGGATGENKDATLPTGTTETTPKTFPIARAEMIPTIRTPEVMAKPIELLPETHQALVDTIVYHFEIIDKLTKRATMQYNFPADSLQGMFYAEFKRRFPDRDLSDPKQLQTATEEFLAKGGAEVRLALKLAEWEAASIQAASGREFKRGKPETMRKGESKAIYTLTPKGLIKAEKPSGLLERWFGGQKIITQVQYEMIGGASITLDPATNVLMNDLQKNFLEEAGWQAGTLTGVQRESLDQRLVSIAQARTDILLQTGLNLKDIELNFIQGGHYLGRTTAHLLKEQTGTNIRDILQTEGKNIAQEVKDKVQKEIDKKKKEAQERKAERTVDQLKRRIEEIKASTSLSEPKREIRITEITAEIQRLQKQLELFSRQRLSAGEITEATTTKDATKKAVEDHQVSMVIPGEGSIDLIKWSSDVSETESCAAIQVQIDELEEIKRPFSEQKQEIDRQITEHYQHKPAERLEKTITKETKGGTTTIHTVEPDPLDKEIKQRWFDELKRLEEERKRLIKQINEDKTQDAGTETLSGKLAKLKAKHARRKAVLEDADIKALLQQYHDAEKALKAKTDEQTEGQAKITALTSGVTPPAGQTAEQVVESNIEEAKKTNEDNKKVLEAGGLTGEDKLEVEALSALTAVYTSDSQRARESRTKEAEQGIINPPEYGPQWQNYPQAILRCVQLIWGDELLEASPADKTLADQVMALMGSQKYLSIFIDVIESTPIQGVTISTRADKSASTTDGAYTNLNEVFSPSGTDVTIKTVTYDKITRDMIEKIVEEMRKKALSITTIP